MGNKPKYKHWKDFSIELDKGALPYFPGFEFKGKYINKDGEEEEVEFTIYTEFDGRDIDFEQESDPDAKAIREILSNDPDAMEELLEIISQSEEYGKAADLYWEPNPKQQKMMDDDEDLTIGDLVDVS